MAFTRSDKQASDMFLSQTVIDVLAVKLHVELSSASIGHCLRVDHLSKDNALLVCEALSHLGEADIEQYVLAGHLNDNKLTITAERAIEIRNRKQTRLCLFVPADLVDAAASSLANSFAVFDVEAAFGEIARELLDRLPAELHHPVSLALRYSNSLPEQKADYISAILADPDEELAGVELWRIGLLPDVGDEGLDSRLERNRRCVRNLIRPPRAHASAEERLSMTGLRRGAVYDELLAFLENRRLRDGRSWLCALSKPPFRGRITFERWTFEDVAGSDLEVIEVAPLLDKEGGVEEYTHLTQENTGDQPVASVGSKAKVSVKWSYTPAKPSNLSKWKAEIIPSREAALDNEGLSPDLPSVKVSGKQKKATIPLDFELDTLPFRAVQVRVSALDELGRELCDQNGQPVYGHSDEFWLSDAEVTTKLINRQQYNSTSTLPYARLKAAVELRVDSIAEASGQWTEGINDVFSVTLNSRRVVRISLSPVLRAIESRCLENPEEGGRYFGAAEAGEFFNPDEALIPLGTDALWETDAGTTFLTRRKELFRLVQRQGPRGLIEVSEWTSDIAGRGRAYANAYQELLRAAPDNLLPTVLGLDTLHLRISHSSREQDSVLILPTHPLRVLWYTAYSELLGKWETEVCSMGDYRTKVLDLSLLERVAPVNCPAFVPAQGDTMFLFAQNLRFFWALALPADLRDPGRYVGEIAAILGLSESEATLTDLPPRRVSEEIRAYIDLHPYLETLRLNVLNPGSGGFIADVVRGLYEEQSEDEEETTNTSVCRVDILNYAHRPVPNRIGPLSEVQREVYGAQPRGRRHFLNPVFSVGLRPIENGDLLAREDVHLSIATDTLKSEVRLTASSEHEDSSSFYGLLVRYLPRFAVDGDRWIWEHRLEFPEGREHERHPAGAYTNLLVDTHRAYLRAVARRLSSAKKGLMPAVIVELSPDERQRIETLHKVSDWVITLDRFAGVDAFDSPQSLGGVGKSRRYLLDYTPEFLEGLGHRMFATTIHRGEVEEILAGAMIDLGFAHVDESIGIVLDHLKTISGRLALRIIGDSSRAREAVSLGVVAAYLRARGELEDTILIPVDSHPELFGPAVRHKVDAASRARCDLIRIQYKRPRLVATFIEVKSRSVGVGDELLERIADQVTVTEEVFQNLFFSKDPVRLDHVLQRSRLGTILRFYLHRSRRYGLVSSDSRVREMEEVIARLETGLVDLKTEKWGFIVNLARAAQKSVTVRETSIRFLTARDFDGIGISTQHRNENTRSSSDGEHSRRDVSPASASAERTASANATTRGTTTGLTMQISSTDGAYPDNDSDLNQKIGVELGLDRTTAEPISWNPSIQGSPHLFMVGIPGQGKSWTITRLLNGLSEQGVAPVVIDFHGQFSQPDFRLNGSVTPVVIDASQGLWFSPLEAEQSMASTVRDWRTNSFAVSEIFQYVCQLGDMQRDVVYEAVRDSYRSAGWDTEEDAALPTLQEVGDRMRRLEAQRGVRNVIARCRPMLELGLFREADASEPSLNNALRSGLVLDLHSLGLDTLQLAAGAFLLRKIYKDMFVWGHAQRLRVAIVLDEAHRLSQDPTLPKIMKEGRKFGIAVIVASQGLADFHSDVIETAGTRVIFRINHPASKKVAGFVRARKDIVVPALIEQLDVGQALVQTPDMGTCSLVNMHPLHTS